MTQLKEGTGFAPDNITVDVKSTATTFAAARKHAVVAIIFSRLEGSKNARATNRGDIIMMIGEERPARIKNAHLSLKWPPAASHSKARMARSPAHQKV